MLQFSLRYVFGGRLIEVLIVDRMEIVYFCEISNLDLNF